MKFIKAHKSEGELILSILVIMAILHFTGIGCPIKYVTGISCLGCGMVRATISLFFRFDVKSAFTYHPLVFIMPFVALYLLFRKRVPKNIGRIIEFTIIGAFVIVYVLRLLSPAGDVVVFAPRDGLIGRLISLVIDCVKFSMKT